MQKGPSPPFPLPTWRNPTPQNASLFWDELKGEGQNLGKSSCGPQGIGFVSCSDCCSSRKAVGKTYSGPACSTYYFIVKSISEPRELVLVCLQQETAAGTRGSKVSPSSEISSSLAGHALRVSMCHCYGYVELVRQ